MGSHIKRKVSELCLGVSTSSKNFSAAELKIRLPATETQNEEDGPPFPDLDLSDEQILFAYSQLKKRRRTELYAKEHLDRLAKLQEEQKIKEEKEKEKRKTRN